MDEGSTEEGGTEEGSWRQLGRAWGWVLEN